MITGLFLLPFVGKACTGDKVRSCAKFILKGVFLLFFPPTVFLPRRLSHVFHLSLCTCVRERVYLPLPLSISLVTDARIRRINSQNISGVKRGLNSYQNNANSRREEFSGCGRKKKKEEFPPTLPPTLPPLLLPPLVNSNLAGERIIFGGSDRKRNYSKRRANVV